MESEFVVTSKNVVMPAGMAPAAILIRNGKIASLDPHDAPAIGRPVFDAGESVVMPGLVDTHVHINEPGRPEWEGFATATRAAAAGGVTTLIEMPLNSIPATTTGSAFQEKIAAAEGNCFVDTGFWGGVVPGNTKELRGLYEAGVFGFKCFLVPSGVPEFECVDERSLREALPVLSSLGAVLLAHSELPGPIAERAAEAAGAPPEKYSTWLASRPREAENQAIRLLFNLSREFGVRLHIVHLSSSDVLRLLWEVRRDGLPVTAETCPHYLFFSAEKIPDGATEFKCAPPIRERENREALWEALKAGDIDLVATDHSPCPPEMKCRETGNFLEAWGGVASLQLGLSALWTQARQRGCTPEQIAEWMCHAPARLAGLDGRKGRIAEGYDADLVVWNPDATFVVEPENLYHRHKVTPYAGRTLYGVVETTFLRGERIYYDGSVQESPTGRVMRRGE